MRPSVVAIVVSYDAGERLLDGVESLLATDYENLEVIVVDNDSPARNAATLDAVAQRARVIRSSTNSGFGRACNAVARTVDADYLVFLNPDVVVTPTWLGPIVDAFERDPAIGIASPTTLYPDEQAPHRTGVAPTATVPGCSLVVRRTVWEQLGGFDEDYFLYWEDTDLCWRAWLAGWTVVESFDSVVVHERGGSSGAGNWAAEQIRNGLRTQLKTMRWRVVAPFALRTFARTLLELARSRDRAIVHAWLWNLRELPSGLRERRRLLVRRAIPAAQLEALVRTHRARVVGERKARSGSTVPLGVEIGGAR